MSAKFRKLKVVGAGFSGLLAAFYLRKRGFEVEVIESEKRTGGLLNTYRLPWGLMETAANGFLANAEIERVASEIGCELIEARRESRRRYIFRGRPRRWPLGFLESLGFLARFLLALVFRFLRPQRGESVEVWGSRVGGPAFQRWVLAPVLAGIYAAPTWRLSAKLLLGRFFGSGRKRGERGRLRGLSAPRGGMGEFIDKLEAHLRAQGVSFRLGTAQTASELLSDSDEVGVVWATSLTEAVPALERLEPALAARLRRVGRVGILTLTAFYEPAKSDVSGFGCLFPRGEGVQALGVLFNAEVFEGRSEGLRAETWIYDLAEAPADDYLVLERLQKDRLRLTASKAEPVGYRLKRWPHALPVYDFELEAALESEAWARLEKSGTFFVGNYRGSLGLSRLIHSVRETVERV